MTDRNHPLREVSRGYVISIYHSSKGVNKPLGFLLGRSNPCKNSKTRFYTDTSGHFVMVVKDSYGEYSLTTQDPHKIAMVNDDRL